MQKTCIYLLVCFILTSSAGFYIFEHHCKIDGKEQSFFIKNDHGCKQDVQQTSCCIESQTDKNDCCDNEVKIVQVEYDFFNDQPGHFIISELPPHFSEIYKFESVEFTATKFFIFSTNDPPNTSGREKIILHQQFRC